MLSEKLKSRMARVISAAVGLATLAAAAPAHAHAGHADHAAGNPWAAWPLSPEILLGLGLAGWIYAVGLRRAPPRGESGSYWQALSFAGGLLALFVALQTPIETIADRVFVVHQVEHMLLQTVGPMLIMLATPQAALIRGLPEWARRVLAAAIADSVLFRSLFAVLSHPVSATVLFIATGWLWMVPRYHDLAILNVPIHYTWHATLLASGLVFFWRVFDPRPSPPGISLPARVVMLFFAAMASILLGVYLSFKEEILYRAYDQAGRLWGLDGLTDERFGGLTMWIPGGMMLAMAALAVVHRMLRREARDAARRGRRAAAEPAPAVEAGAFRGERRPANRALAIGLAGFVLAVFVLAISAAVLYDQRLAHPS